MKRVAMVYISEKHPRCSYIGQKGVCGRRCFRGLCAAHIHRKSLALCSNCKVRGTTSKTGVCQSIESGCKWKAQYISTKMKAATDAMDAFIDSLVEDCSRYYEAKE